MLISSSACLLNSVSAGFSLSLLGSNPTETEFDPSLHPDCGSTFKTQKRHIKLWCQLICLEPLSSESERLQASVALGISNLHLREAADRIRAGPTYESRARIVMGVLNVLTEGSILRAILQQGHTVRLWGSPNFDERDRVPLLHFTSCNVTVSSYHVES